MDPKSIAIVLIREVSRIALMSGLIAGLIVGVAYLIWQAGGGGVDVTEAGEVAAAPSPRPRDFGVFIHCYCDRKPLEVFTFVKLPRAAKISECSAVDLAPEFIGVGGKFYERDSLPPQQFDTGNVIVAYKLFRGDREQSEGRERRAQNPDGSTVIYE